MQRRGTRSRIDLSDQTLTVLSSRQEDGLIRDAVRGSFGFIWYRVPPLNSLQLCFKKKTLNPSEFSKQLNDAALMAAAV